MNLSANAACSPRWWTARTNWRSATTLLPQHWGKGYAAEAAIACKRFATERGLASSLISLIDEENHRSQAVARRNGMACDKRTVHRGVPAQVFRVLLGHSAK
ncbi:MAG: GNAT family N-acetyltransferase [Saprospiraceae bacterium]|nr:GNAT family N-acetyltransferase [Saprospiraceae bacterium]